MKSHSLLRMHNRWQDAIGQKKAVFHSMAIRSDTHNGTKCYQVGTNIIMWR